MEKKLSLTDAEWSVMEQLWAAPGSTGRALTAALEQKTGWSRSTTLTLLRRLAEKGAVLGRVYHGSLSMLVSAMTREETLPQEEIDELYALLNEMEAKKRRD